MPPAPPKKRMSPEPNATEEDGPQTPSGCPPTKKPKITPKQKQALIDNLQLEITERARNLRAHYALQAQDLRSRLERRVNRIPVGLRKQTMGELLAKYSQSPKKAENSPEATKKRAPKATRKATGAKAKVAPAAGKKATSAEPKRGKRKSDELHTSDKENAPVSEDANPPLANPKKRTKPNATGSSKAVPQLATSDLSESRVLSPKSSNSRTFPHSPLKSPSKTQHQQYMSRRPSPLKLASPIKAAANRMSEAAKTRTTRGTTAAQKNAAQENVAPATNAKKGPTKSTASATSSTPYGTARQAPPSRPATREHNRQISTSTTASNASNGTTIVRSTRANTATGKATKSTPAADAKKSSVPRGLTSTASSAAKKVPTTKKARSIEPPAPGRRILRNRG